MDDARRKCPSCLLRLPLTAFARNAYKPSGAQSYCRPCENARQRAYSLKNKLRHLLDSGTWPDYVLRAVIDDLERSRQNKRSPKA